MNLSTRTKSITVQGTEYTVREPSAAEFALYLQTRSDGNAKSITVESLEAADKTTAVLLARCIVEPKIDLKRAQELSSDSVSGLALMAAIMGLGARSRTLDEVLDKPAIETEEAASAEASGEAPPEKETDAG